MNSPKQARYGCIACRFLVSLVFVTLLAADQRSVPPNAVALVETDYNLWITAARVTSV